MKIQKVLYALLLLNGINLALFAEVSDDKLTAAKEYRQVLINTKTLNTDEKSAAVEEYINKYPEFEKYGIASINQLIKECKAVAPSTESSFSSESAAVPSNLSEDRIAPEKIYNLETLRKIPVNQENSEIVKAIEQEKRNKRLAAQRKDFTSEEIAEMHKRMSKISKMTPEEKYNYNMNVNSNNFKSITTTQAIAAQASTEPLIVSQQLNAINNAKREANIAALYAASDKANDTIKARDVEAEYQNSMKNFQAADLAQALQTEQERIAYDEKFKKEDAQRDARIKAYKEIPYADQIQELEEFKPAVTNSSLVSNENVVRVASDQPIVTLTNQPINNHDDLRTPIQNKINKIDLRLRQNKINKINLRLRQDQDSKVTYDKIFKNSSSDDKFLDINPMMMARNKKVVTKLSDSNLEDLKAESLGQFSDDESISPTAVASNSPPTTPAKDGLASQDSSKRMNSGSPSKLYKKSPSRLLEDQYEMSLLMRKNKITPPSSTFSKIEEVD